MKTIINQIIFVDEKESVREMLKIIGTDEDPFVVLRWLRSTQVNIDR